MAQLSKDDVLKLARLARLKLTSEEANSFQKEISDILGYVDKLKDVDVKGLKPTYQVTGLVNVTRMDETKDYGTTKEELLKNIPNRQDDYIKVNRMVG